MSEYGSENFSGGLIEMRKLYSVCCELPIFNGAFRDSSMVVEQLDESFILIVETIRHTLYFTHKLYQRRI